MPNTKYFLILFLLSDLSCAYGQNFVNIGSDKTGDCICACTDIKSLDYAYDAGQDSAWFRITTQNPRGSDWAYYIAVDLDKNQSNGSTWTGAGTFGQCPGLHDYNKAHDRIAIVWPGNTMLEAFTQGGGVPVSGATVKYKLIDPYTTVINTKLSEIDSNKDGDINLIASVGLGLYEYKPYDVLPDQGQINTASSGIEESVMPVLWEIVISPNPAKDFIKISLIGGSGFQNPAFSLRDITGREILFVRRDAMSVNDIIIDISGVEQGIYVLLASNCRSSSIMEKVVVDR